MDPERRAELQGQVEVFRAVDEMVKTPGWQQYVIPRFERLKEAALNRLMQASELADFVKAQQTVCAIDSVLLDLRTDIRDGEEAAKLLAELKDESD